MRETDADGVKEVKIEKNCRIEQLIEPSAEYEAKRAEQRLLIAQAEEQSRLEGIDRLKRDLGLIV